MILRSFAIEGIRYQLEEVCCGKANCGKCPHGPYWRSYWFSNGKKYSRYIGKQLPPGVRQPVDAARLLTVAPEMAPRTAARLLGISLSHPYERAHARYRAVRLDAIGFGEEAHALVRQIDAAWLALARYHGWIPAGPEHGKNGPVHPKRPKR